MSIFKKLKRLTCQCRVADCHTDDGYTVTCDNCGRTFRLARKVVGDMARRSACQQAARDAGFYSGGYVSDGSAIFPTR